MEFPFFLAAVGLLVWAWSVMMPKWRGFKHHRAARRLAAQGDWEQAALSYKIAIVNRLHSDGDLKVLIKELADLYRAHGMEADLSRVFECPKILNGLPKGTEDLPRKKAVIQKAYTETIAFLDSFPGPKVP